MAKLIAVCRDEEFPFERRQIPLMIEETLTVRKKSFKTFSCHFFFVRVLFVCLQNLVITKFCSNLFLKLICFVLRLSLSYILRDSSEKVTKLKDKSHNWLLFSLPLLVQSRKTPMSNNMIKKKNTQVEHKYYQNQKAIFSIQHAATSNQENNLKLFLLKIHFGPPSKNTSSLQFKNKK